MLRCFGRLRGSTTLLFDEPANAHTPQTFGPYRVLHQIGSGVLGPVFRAADTRRDHIVAIKAFSLDLRPDQADALAEALRALRRTAPDRRSAVSVIDAGSEGHTPYLAMTFEAGETLDQLLRQKERRSTDRIATLVARLAEVLDAFAAEGCLHGGLHPRDVFVTASGDGLRLTGLGVSQALAAAGIHWPGRRPYASPERASERWDARADVYALGVIAHEWLTGRKPLHAGEQDGEFGPEIALGQRPRLRRLLAAALAEWPEDRLPSAGAFSAALADLLGQTLPLPEAETSRWPSRLPAPISPDSVPGVAGAQTDVSAEGGRVEPSFDPKSDQEFDQGWMLTSGPVGRPNQEPRLVGLESEDFADLTLGSERLPAEAELLEGPRWDAAESVAADSDERGAPRGGWVLVAVAFAGLFLGGLSVVAAVQGGLVPAPRSSSVTSSSAVAEVGFEIRDIAPEPETLETLEPQEAAGPPDAGNPALAPTGDGDVTPEAASAVTLSNVPGLQLAPQTAPGRLVVESNVEGALVTIDGRIFGSTPATARGLGLGTHTVQVARPGYAPARVTVALTAAAPAQTVRVPLEPGLPPTGVPPQAQPAGAIDVDSRPRGARVSIDGRFVGHAPLRLADLRPGTHVLTVEMSGYAQARQPVQVESGLVARLVVDLEN